MEDDSIVGLALGECKEKMAAATAHANHDFASVRTGRASPTLVENLRAEYYGTETPLQQLASFSVPEARLLVIAPFDKAAIKGIEKAIQNSDLGLQPNSDGNVIRLAFPELTQDRRREMVKLVHAKAEDARVAVRNCRRAARKELEAFEKDGDITTDELERAEKDLEKITHAAVAEIDRLLQNKEHELLEV
ncbi:MAG: ribosome recycling factor [Actinomycetota bacterium]|jgi:ribosome recycling factor